MCTLFPPGRPRAGQSQNQHRIVCDSSYDPLAMAADLQLNPIPPYPIGAVANEGFRILNEKDPGLLVVKADHLALVSINGGGLVRRNRKRLSLMRKIGCDEFLREIRPQKYEP